MIEIKISKNFVLHTVTEILKLHGSGAWITLGHQNPMGNDGQLTLSEHTGFIKKKML